MTRMTMKAALAVSAFVLSASTVHAAPISLSDAQMDAVAAR